MCSFLEGLYESVAEVLPEDDRDLPGKHLNTLPRVADPFDAVDVVDATSQHPGGAL